MPRGGRAREGSIVHDGIYGTLDGEQPVQVSTLYDLASITKFAASTLSLMRLEEEGKISLNASLDTYLPELEGTDMGSRQLRDVCLTVRASIVDPVLFGSPGRQHRVFTGAHRNPSGTHFRRVLLHSDRPGAIPSGTASSLLKSMPWAPLQRLGVLRHSAHH